MTFGSNAKDGIAISNKLKRMEGRLKSTYNGYEHGIYAG